MTRTSGTSKPPLKLTADTVYTHINAKTGKALQNAIYDGQGDLIGHVDFKNHGLAATSGHGHRFPPGDPVAGHGRGSNHLAHATLPSGWADLPAGVLPHTPIGS